MQKTSLIDSRMAGNLAENHFPALCTIQEHVDGTDSNGQPTEMWSNLAGHVDIPCSVQLTAGRKVRTGENEYGLTTHRISLAGSYPTISRLHRAVVSGVTYEIQYCSPAGFSNSITFLDCNLASGGT